MRSLLLVFVLACPAFAGSVAWPTAHGSNMRTGWNAGETVLTPANVASGKFAKLGTYTVDGSIYAQPLVIPGVTVAGAAHDLLIVSTMHNSIYAFDANLPGSAYLWRLNFGAPVTTYPDVSIGPLLYGAEIGCLSTPVADIAANILYSVCASPTPSWVLRKIDLTTGTVQSSVTVTGQVVGTGDVGRSGRPGDDTVGPADTTSGSNLLFYPYYQLQRCALTLSGGKVFIGFGSYADVRPWHGWIFAYDASTLSQTAVFCTSPNDYGAGIWTASGGITVDGSGNLIVATGNGLWNGVTEFGISLLKLSPALALLDYFTPSNYSTMTANDSDMSSGRAMLIAGTTWCVFGAKDFKVYAVDTANMGHLQTGSSTAQVFYTNSAGVLTDHSGIYGGMLMNNTAYFPNTGGTAYAYSFSGATFNTTAAATSPVFGFPGATMTGSSNGASNSIVWALTVSATALYNRQNATLRALNPATFAEYWDSDTAPGAADAVGLLSKFNAPVVVNGYVYVPSYSGTVSMYGLIPSGRLRGQAAARGRAVIR